MATKDNDPSHKHPSSQRNFTTLHPFLSLRACCRGSSVNVSSFFCCREMLQLAGYWQEFCVFFEVGPKIREYFGAFLERKFATQNKKYFVPTSSCRSRKWKRARYERGVFPLGRPLSRISNISLKRTSEISRDWSDSPSFSRLWRL